MSNVVSVPANPGQDPKDVAQFWTPDRMESAQPAPMPVVVMDGNGNVVREGWSGKDGQIYDTREEAADSYGDGPGSTGSDGGTDPSPAGWSGSAEAAKGQQKPGKGAAGGHQDETGEEQLGRWITKAEVMLAVRDRDPEAIRQAGTALTEVGQQVQAGTTQTGQQWAVAASSAGGRPVWQSAEQPLLQEQMGLLHPQAALLQHDLGAVGKAMTQFAGDVQDVLADRAKLITAVAAFQKKVQAAAGDPEKLAALEAENKQLRTRKRGLTAQLTAAKKKAAQAIDNPGGGAPKARILPAGTSGKPGQVEPGAPLGDNGVVSVELNQDPAAVAAFWTPDRMAAAQPMPMPTV